MSCKYGWTLQLYLISTLCTPTYKQKHSCATNPSGVFLWAYALMFVAHQLVVSTQIIDWNESIQQW